MSQTLHETDFYQKKNCCLSDIESRLSARIFIFWIWQPSSQWNWDPVVFNSTQGSTTPLDQSYCVPSFLPNSGSPSILKEMTPVQAFVSGSTFGESQVKI